MNKPKHIAIFYVLLILGLLGSCTSIKEDPSIFFNLDEEFSIRPIEILSRYENKLSLEINALVPNACDDSEIIYQYRLVDGISVIKLNDIISPLSCQTSETPPSTNVILNKSNPMEYKLNITIKEIVENRGEIIETDDYFDFHMYTFNGIRVERTRLNKIPPTAFWGGVDYDFQDSSYVAANFVDEIMALSSGVELESGYYGHFDNANGEVAVLNDLNSNLHRSSFSINSHSSFGQIAPIVEKYQNQYPNFRFFAYNAFGESL